MVLVVLVVEGGGGGGGDGGFGSPLSSKSCGLWTLLSATLSLTVNETLKRLSALAILMHESFWWWLCFRLSFLFKKSWFVVRTLTL